MTLLKLGCYDDDINHPIHTHSAIKSHFDKLNHQMSANLIQRHQLRDDGDWFNAVPVKGNSVRSIQEFLKRAGFMPFREPNGIFDYFTLSSVRLFQEYVRTVEKDEEIGKPDGIVGNKFHQAQQRWEFQQNQCDWGLKQIEVQTPEQMEKWQFYQEESHKWLNIMKKAQQHYLVNPDPILEKVNAVAQTGGSRKLADWTFHPDDVHLVGIRRNQDNTLFRRDNDDLFKLIINGMVFTFWGSTDPSQHMAKKQKKDSNGNLLFDEHGNPIMIHREDIPFLVEGQHLFRFGWHKFSSAEKIYKALEPMDDGVLVIRDIEGDNALTANDFEKGTLSRNDTINIHWSGIGSSNFSAGCQVIAGKSYMNPDHGFSSPGQEAVEGIVDCSNFAASSYNGLKSGQTKGAYNVLADLIITYSQPKPVHTVLYTLGRDDVLNLEPGIKEDLARVLAKVKNSNLA